MWNRVLQLLSVSCRHRHISQPFSTASNRKASAQADWDSITTQESGPYVVCLDCGKHFEYDWSRMRVVK